ncbi:MAG: protein kinase [Candidatus Korobacteraceae bacterium]
MLGTGQQFGRYRVKKKLGAGAMGEVYHAHDTQLNRDVALKVLQSSDTASDLDREEILNEARASSALNHPNICVVYEAGEVDGRVYIAMEYIEGKQLSDVIPTAGLSTDVTIRYGLQLADALAHAHGHGVVHRDLKPSNIMVTPDGRIKLLDFGLARPIPMTETGSTASLIHGEKLAGTLPYMAPEILTGSTAQASSDIWSFGVVLYEMVTGRHPFRGRTEFELSSAIIHDPAPTLPDHVGARLSVIVNRCLEKTPQRRYQRVGEARSALEAIQPASLSQYSVPVPRSQPRQLKRIVAVGATILGSLGLIWFAISRRSLEERSPSPVRSLAVLPFVNLSSDADRQYFADGMTEQLITQLGTISNLRVISRTSVMHYKGTHATVPEIAKELHVDAVIQGSIMPANDRVRVSIQLTDARTDANIWTQSYNRDLRDLVRVQDELAIAIARQIQANLAPQGKTEASTAGTTNAEAYQLYLRARYFWNQTTPEGYQKALALFLKAIAADPNYAQAYCGLADTYTLMQDDGLISPAEAYPLARGAAEKAVQLNDSLAEAHTSLGGNLQDYDRNWSAAEEEYKRAVELNPNYATAHQWYSTLLTMLGRNEESIAEARKASELAPLTARVTIDLGYALFHAKRYDEAIEQAQKGLELDSRLAGGYELLGRAYLSKGMGQEAIRQFQQAESLTDNSMTDRALLAYAYARIGKSQQALTILRQLETLPESSAPYFHIAMIYTALNEREKALSAVEQAGRWERDKWPQCFGMEEAFDPIRSDPRFRSVLQQFQLSAEERG